MQYFKWRDHQIYGNNLMLFPESGEIDAVSYLGFKVFTFSLNKELIRRLLDIEVNQWPLLIPENAVALELSSHDMKILRHSVSYLFNKVKLDPRVIEKDAFKRLLTMEVPSLLLGSLQTTIPKPKAVKPRIRDIVLIKARTYLNTCSTDFPNVYELCLIAGASQRTLEYAFKENFGISPQNYIKNLRLNRARKNLSLSNRGKSSIGKIANQMGFWHLGQFAADYKKLFGELPSETMTIRPKFNHS